MPGKTVVPPLRGLSAIPNGGPRRTGGFDPSTLKDAKGGPKGSRPAGVRKEAMHGKNRGR